MPVSSELRNIKIQLREAIVPSTPLAGFLKVYAKDDHKLYTKNSDGVETLLGAGGGEGGSGGKVRLLIGARPDRPPDAGILAVYALQDLKLYKMASDGIEQPLEIGGTPPDPQPQQQSSARGFFLS